jgi:formylglycine-generating enzyme required for sulfatase activity
MTRRLRSLIWILGSVAGVGACSSARSGSGGTGATTDPTLTTPPGGDVDGGAPRPPCTKNDECASGSCSHNRCAAPAGSGGDPSPPPPKPCGVASGTKCALDRDCASNADCTSNLCGTAGPSTGKCVSAKSCTGGPGANTKCNDGNDDCCESIAVPGGSFTNYDRTAASAATVAPFKLDKFEITVGRMRAYYTALGGNPRGNPPAPGAGAHPLIPNSGWRATWNVRLPGSWVEINARHAGECAVGGNNAQWGAATWTPEPGSNEEKPINCIDWYTLFAFAIWDGGRLATDAEWSFVAYSGSEQRTFPWGNDVAAFDTHRAVLVTSFLVTGTTFGRYTEGPEYRVVDEGPRHIAQVGTKTERSKWGHADLGGNVLEYVLDVARSLPASCVNCANVAFPDPPQGPPVQPLRWQPLDANGNPPPGDGPDDFADARAVQDGKRFARGGSWMGEYEGHYLPNKTNRFWAPVWRTYGALGGRVARGL